MGNLKSAVGGRRNVEETLPDFGLSYAKPFLLKAAYLVTLQNCDNSGHSTFLYLSIL